ncbi:UPF0602 protein C4orf47 homolog [Belonocnema kinseyi]|uniref:UPF0602 protein C4orf47 homolog n=1 Tax=Belonocnema kinseyi TaxID=2817044 RepID=UPI00143DE5CA|nr:UPF0602 protein C4orf47 homolog [Belonocnema kinseyi]
MDKGIGGSVGSHFGKVDLDRVGFFDDPPPGPFNKYVKPFELRDGVAKGRQMLCGQPGDLFEKEFKRIFRGEALTEPSRDEAKVKLKNKKRGRHLIPTSGAKKHSTPGDWFGCFGEKPSHFSPELRKSATKKEPANFKTKPNPLGGPGYVDICLNPYPKYANEPYDPVNVDRKKATKVGKFISTSSPLDFFPPNPYHSTKIGPTYVRPHKKLGKVIGTGRIYVPFPKNPGGSHAGCFSEYPKYISELYQPKIRKSQREPRWIGGAPDLRSKYTSSIINQVTQVSCNASNYMEYQAKVYPL